MAVCITGNPSMKALARRAFLKLAPGAALAGKVTADQAISQAAGINFGMTSSAAAMHPGAAPRADASVFKRAITFIGKQGIPDFKRESLFWESRFVNALDPDLAAKRSWSMSVKIMTQRQRNLDRLMEAEHKRWGWDEARRAFSERHGFWWY